MVTVNQALMVLGGYFAVVFVLGLYWVRREAAQHRHDGVRPERRPLKTETGPSRGGDHYAAYSGSRQEAARF